MESKVALVTGASSGIGYSLTKELVSKGFTVYAAARRVDPIKKLKDRLGNQVIPIYLDISNEDNIISLKKQLRNELPDGKLDLLYNNAGQSCTIPALDITNADMEYAFKVNVFGPINMCRELSEFVIKAKGTIVFTGSIAGIVPFPFASIYSATKASIHQYARVLHLEMKPFGVRVINVITGGVDTNIADSRELLNSSLYYFPEGISAFESRRTMAKNNNPMNPDLYACKVVSDILSRNDPVDLYHGFLSSILSWIMIFIPYSILEWGLAKKFGLDRVSSLLQEKSRTKGT